MSRIGLVLAAFVLAASARAEEEGPRSSDTVTVRLRDGSVLVGTITTSDERHLEVRTASGAAVDVPRASIATIDEGVPETRAEAATAVVEDETRLFLAPTGRPLRSGEGYFSDHYVLFPGLAYGVTDHFTLAGGVSMVPGVDLGEQVGYFTPKLGTRLGANAAVSLGGLLARGADETLSVGYAVATFGAEASSFSGGVGFGHAGDGDTQPIVMIGGATRIARRVSLLTENWFFPGEDYQFLSAGLRIRGDRLTVDFGFVTTGELLDEGGLTAVPWLSFAYHFGGRGARASYRAAR
jgi:hypothetical protein